MLTSVDAIRDARPGYRPYRLRIGGVRALTPHFRQLTLLGDDLSTFGTDGLDQRIKLLVPFDDGTTCVLDEPSWYQSWRALPTERRNPIRTLTVRAIRPWANELDIVVASHGALGPLGRWLQRVRPGDEVVVVGPDARSLDCGQGIDFRPGPAERIVLLGDETAAPAVAAICERLPAWRRALALVEVPTAGDRLPVEHGEHVDLRWLPRPHGPVGSRLVPAVRALLDRAGHQIAGARAPRAQPVPEVDVDTELLWEVPSAGASAQLYVWLAAEAAVVKSLRRVLVNQHGLDRRAVAFMGYWRHGVAERSE
ncbi:MAG: siderophore-interacting protein [Actinobacteria bacterium]|nr:siderophore-interacting protein [Actinomycetota bacterium]MCG2800979.1 siderophore-interacting protein [Cellulomonas sp.]